MAAPLAQVEDIEARRGHLDPGQRTAAAELLAEASARLRVRVPTLDDRVAGGRLDPIIAKGVVCRMVIDALNNPNRLRSEQVDDVLYTYDRSTVAMEPTADELAALQPSKGASGGVGVARTRPLI